MSILSDRLSDAIKLVERSHEIICENDGLDKRLHQISDEHMHCMLHILMIVLLREILTKLS
jgi:hypothetical protein